MTPIAVFYHALFVLDGKLLERACAIVYQQMEAMKSSGLLEAANIFNVYVNGGNESISYVDQFIPRKASVIMNGAQCKNECRTVMSVGRFAAMFPAWNILYFHSKGATNPNHELYLGTKIPWRDNMMNVCVHNWRHRVEDLDSGYDVVGDRWMEPPETPGNQRIMAGNFWWARANYLRKLPSIADTDRIRISGIDSPESRYEAEVWIGNASVLPRVKAYYSNR